MVFVVFVGQKHWFLQCFCPLPRLDGFAQKCQKPRYILHVILYDISFSHEFPWHKPGVFPWHTPQQKNTFGNCFDGVRIIPSHVQGYVCGAEACCGHQSRRIGFAKRFLLQRWQQLRTCYCVSIFKKMYGEGPLTFLMAASRDITTVFNVHVLLKFQ